MIMKPIQRRVRRIEWRRSTVSGNFYRVGVVRLHATDVMVFEANGQWLSASPGQFGP